MPNHYALMHPASERVYNPQPNVNWGNAGGGQSAADTRRANGTGRGGAGSHVVHVPAAAAPTGNLFTFERVVQVHCVADVAYPVKCDSPEAEFFTAQINRAAEHMRSHVADNTTVTAFVERADVPFITLVEVHYGQLRVIYEVTQNMLDALPDELKDGVNPTDYTSYTADNKTYCMSPTGEHYHVVKPAQWVRPPNECPNPCPLHLRVPRCLGADGEGGM